MAERILRLQEVKARTTLGRSTIYDAIARGDFPQPMKLGLRAVGWIEAEIDAWVEARKAQRKAA
jgi:prophage regulatory protein